MPRYAHESLKMDACVAVTRHKQYFNGDTPVYELLIKPGALGYPQVLILNHNLLWRQGYAVL